MTPIGAWLIARFEALTLGGRAKVAEPIIVATSVTTGALAFAQAKDFEEIVIV